MSYIGDLYTIDSHYRHYINNKVFALQTTPINKKIVLSYFDKSITILITNYWTRI